MHLAAELSRSLCIDLLCSSPHVHSPTYTCVLCVFLHVHLHMLSNYRFFACQWHLLPTSFNICSDDTLFVTEEKGGWVLGTQTRDDPFGGEHVPSRWWGLVHRITMRLLKSRHNKYVNTSKASVRSLWAGWTLSITSQFDFFDYLWCVLSWKIAELTNTESW